MVSKKPKLDPEDCLFVIAQTSDDPYWAIYITPKKYFEERGCLLDQHISIEGFNYPAVMEGMFDMPHQDPEEERDKLLRLGFKEDRKLMEFMSRGGNKVFGYND